MSYYNDEQEKAEDRVLGFTAILLVLLILGGTVFVFWQKTHTSITATATEITK